MLAPPSLPSSPSPAPPSFFFRYWCCACVRASPPPPPRVPPPALLASDGFTNGQEERRKGIKNTKGSRLLASRTTQLTYAPPPSVPSLCPRASSLPSVLLSPAYPFFLCVCSPLLLCFHVCVEHPPSLVGFFCFLLPRRARARACHARAKEGERELAQARASLVHVLISRWCVCSLAGPALCFPLSPFPCREVCTRLLCWRSVFFLLFTFAPLFQARARARGCVEGAASEPRCSSCLSTSAHTHLRVPALALLFPMEHSVSFFFACFNFTAAGTCAWHAIYTMAFRVVWQSVANAAGNFFFFSFGCCCLWCCPPLPAVEKWPDGRHGLNNNKRVYRAITSSNAAAREGGKQTNKQKKTPRCSLALFVSHPNRSSTMDWRRCTAGLVLTRLQYRRMQHLGGE